VIDPLANVVEAMAQTAYEAGRREAPSLPPWDRCEPRWRDEERRAMRAALERGMAAGLIEVRG
jgi:hypothetical protein